MSHLISFVGGMAVQIDELYRAADRVRDRMPDSDERKVILFAIVQDINTLDARISGLIAPEVRKRAKGWEP